MNTASECQEQYSDKTKQKHRKRSRIWFRTYTDELNNPQIQRLSPPLFKTWRNLQCVAAEDHGTLPDVAKLAYRLRKRSLQRMQDDLAQLIEKGLFRVADDGSIIAADWETRQFVSDSSTERVRELRDVARRRAAASEAPERQLDENEEFNDFI